jgi:hypothetical protein
VAGCCKKLWRERKVKRRDILSKYSEVVNKVIATKMSKARVATILAIPF